MKSILDQLGVQVLPLVETALGGLLCALIAMATAYIKSKTTNTKVQGALDRLDQVMEDAVKDTQQRVVSSIKPEDNMSQALADAKAAAIDSVKSHYGRRVSTS
jgi:gas vesicle protein